MDTDLLKRRAAEEAAVLVESGMRVGLGSGTTVAFLIDALGNRLKTGGLRATAFVPTSAATAERAAQRGLRLDGFDETPRVDLAIDGADEFTPTLDLMKGLGGALLREKVVAAAADRFVVIADASKRVARLGERAPLPVEVLPFAAAPVMVQVRLLGGDPVLRGGAHPVETDQGNWVLDCAFGPLDRPAPLAAELSAMPGVMEHGLFLGMADTVIESTESGIRTWNREER